MRCGTAAGKPRKRMRRGPGGTRAGFCERRSAGSVRRNCPGRICSGKSAGSRPRHGRRSTDPAPPGRRRPAARRFGRNFSPLWIRRLRGHAVREQRKRLPVGIGGFARMRRENRGNAGKTGLIREAHRSRSRATLSARPRRFGGSRPAGLPRIVRRPPGSCAADPTPGRKKIRRIRKFPVDRARPVCTTDDGSLGKGIDPLGLRVRLAAAFLSPAG